VRHSLSCIALALALGPASVAGASVTYNLVNYPADQGGATVSGYFTVRDHSNELSTSDILDWSITISQPALGSYTTGQSDPGAMLSPLGQIVLTPTEMTITPGAGWLLVQSGNVLLSYARNGTDEYDGQGGNTISWQTKSPSMGGTEPWVIARTLGAAIPEPSSLVLLGTAILGLGISRAGRRWGPHGNTHRRHTPS
jgi:hypothetical protein